MIVSGAQMRQLDQEIIRRGVRPEALMEVVGLSVAKAVMRIRQEAKQNASTVTRPCCHIVAGKGHNGADGYVTGRYLVAAGWRVVAWQTVKSELLSPLCAQQQRAFIAMGGVMAAATDNLADADVVVDAILGIATRLPVEDSLRVWLRAIRSVACPIVAIDLPSGVHADDGRVDDDAIKADVTVTCGVGKQGLYQYPGRLYAGQVEIAPLGITDALLEAYGCTTRLMDAKAAARLWRPRVADSHKGTYGRAGVCAGSPGMYGAARLALSATSKAGAGLVKYFAATEVLQSLGAALPPEIVTHAVGEHQSGHLNAEAVVAYAAVLEECTAGLLGPGIGEEWVTLATHSPEALTVLSTVPRPLVLDATALSMIACLPDKGAAFWRSRKGPTVITPHPKECSRLTGLSVAEIQSKRIEVAESYAQTHGIIVVLKGAATVIADADGRVAINSSGNSGLATAGTGDVLAGLVTGMLASGYEAYAAARLGVYLHGRSAEIACEHGVSEESLTASDVLDHVGAVWQEMRNAASTNSPGN